MRYNTVCLEEGQTPKRNIRMPPKCSPHIAPSGVPCIRPPRPQDPEGARLPVMTVNGVAPDKSGNVIVGIPELDQLKGKVVQLENDDHAYSLLKTIAEALGMQVGAGGSWTGTSYVSLGAFATKDTIGPDDLTPELKAQLKGDKGDAGQVGLQGPRGIQGVRGETGERGPQGERGDTGDQGPQGLQGPPGASITVTRTQETSEPGGYNVVTLSDGTTLNIRNGIEGPAGQKGEQGERGEKGDTGEKGEKGDKGDKGADGTVAFEYLTDEQKASLKGDKGDPGEIPTIDSELDLTSSNPVMNSAIAAELLNLRTLAASQYYPEGNVKDASELTAGIKYNFDAAGSDRTVMAAPFSNTGDPDNDNSGLIGRVVIPPFVDSDGNPYISDDGTRYKVVGVDSGSREGGDNVNLTSIIAPSTVTTIRSVAFAGCSSLASVSLPAATTIGDHAFVSGYELTSISLPAATTIGYGVFANCFGLTSVSLPAATTIGEYAFNSCSSLSSVYLPAVTSIGGYAFDFCSSLPSVSLPSAKTIGESAFAQCYALSYVDFGATPRPSVPTIGAYALAAVPTSCKIIVPEAQYDKWVATSNWSSLVTEGYTFLRHSEWEYVRKYEVDNKVDPLLFAEYYPEGNVKSAEEFTQGIKYSLLELDDRTIMVKPFCNTGNSRNDNSGLTGRVVIPPFVDANGNPYISDDGTRYKVVGVDVGSQGDGAAILTSIVAPSTVTTIGTNAFYRCSAMTSVSLPAVTTIGSSAFGSCFGLTSVSLPAATTVGSGVFGGCFNLTSVYLPAATSIGGSAFVSCESLVSVDFGGTPRPSVPTLGNNAFGYIPTSCKIIVPDAQYDEWVAAPGWSDLVTAGHTFLRHSE